MQILKAVLKAAIYLFLGIFVVSIIAAVVNVAFAQATTGCPQGLVNKAFPPFAITVDENSGAVWMLQRGYCPRDGGGSFYQFLSPNTLGIERPGIVFNGGLVEATPDKENGDLDIGIMVDGQYGYTISFTGNFQGEGAGILMWPPDFFNLGAPANRWKAIYLTTVPCPASAPTRECINVNGGFVPIYR